MPTIIRSGPYRVFFFSNEGDEPPHVHVQRERLIAKYWLSPITMAANQGFRGVELGRIEAILIVNEDSLLEAWHEHFDS